MRPPRPFYATCLLLCLCANRIPNPTVSPPPVITLQNPIMKLPPSEPPSLHRDYTLLDDKRLLARDFFPYGRALSMTDVSTGAFRPIMTVNRRDPRMIVLEQSAAGLSPDGRKFFVYMGDRGVQDYVNVMDRNGKRLQSVNASLISSRKIRASNAIWLRDSRKWTILVLEREGFVAYLYALGAAAALRRIPLGGLPGAVLIPDGAGAALIGEIEEGRLTGIGNFANLSDGTLFEFSVNPPYQQRDYPFHIPAKGDLHAIALSPNKRRIAWLIIAPNPLWRKEGDVSNHYELWLSDARARKFAYAGRFPHGSVVSKAIVWGRGGDALLVIADGAVHKVPVEAEKQEYAQPLAN